MICWYVKLFTSWSAGTSNCLPHDLLVCKTVYLVICGYVTALFGWVMKGSFILQLAQQLKNHNLKCSWGAAGWQDIVQGFTTDTPAKSTPMRRIQAEGQPKYCTTMDTSTVEVQPATVLNYDRYKQRYIHTPQYNVSGTADHVTSDAVMWRLSHGHWVGESQVLHYIRWTRRLQAILTGPRRPETLSQRGCVEFNLWKSRHLRSRVS